MKRKPILILGFFVLLFAASISAQQVNKLLTNADIVEMLKAGLPESTILISIQQSQTDLDASPKALIELKQQGASAKVLDALIVNSNKTAPKEKSQDSDNFNVSSTIKISAYDFNFELASCTSSGGDSVTCTFTVTNKERTDRGLHIDKTSQMIDETGKEYLIAERTLGNQKRRDDDWWYGRLNVILIPEVSVIGTVKFEKVESNATTIKVLRIACNSDNKDFNVDFFNIPIIGKKSSASNKNSRDLMLGMSFYEKGNPEESFDYLSKAIANGEKATFLVYHRMNGPGLGLDDDMYLGYLYLGKDSVEFRSAGDVMSNSGMLRVPYNNFKIPINKIFSYKVEPRKQGRLNLELLIADDKGIEKKKTYNFYPHTARLLNTGRGGPYWEIRCADCEQRSQVLARLLQKIMENLSISK